MSGAIPRPELKNIDSAAAIWLRMQEQSLRVPWRELSAAVQQIVEHLALALWVRSSVNCDRSIPVLVTNELEKHMPGFLVARSSGASADDLWSDIIEWFNLHRIATAKEAGWIEAAHYYAGRDPRSELYWQHWEHSSGRMRESDEPPCPFEQWKADAIQGFVFPEATALEKAIEAEAFALWASLVVERGGRDVDVEAAIRARCPHLLLPNPLPRRDQPALNQFRHTLLSAMLASHPRAEAVIHHARNHLRYERVVAYFEHCSRTWRLSRHEPIPSFEPWLQAADHYIIAA